MKRQQTHADRALLLRGQIPKRAQILLGADIELAFSFTKHEVPFIKLLLDALAFFSMLLAMFVLAFLIAIPNALAPAALLEGITLLFARRTQLGRGGPIFHVGFGIVILSLRGFTE